MYEICRGHPLPSNGPDWHAVRSGRPPPIDFGSVDPGNDLMLVLNQMMTVRACVHVSVENLCPCIRSLTPLDPSLFPSVRT